MKKRIAIVRGPNLNSWEMQIFQPLMDSYDIVGFTSRGHNFDVSSIPFEVQKLFSLGQFARARALRKIMCRTMGDYHDLQGLERALKGFEVVNTAEISYYCTYQAAKAKKKLGFKLIVTVWENIPFLLHYPPTAKNKSAVIEATDLFLAVSERAKEVLVLEGAPVETIKVQMPGIDTGHFTPMQKDPELLKRFGCSKNDLIVLFVANLYREKGIFDLLFAFKCLVDRLKGGPGLKLLIAGKGHEKENIAQLIKDLRLGEKARIIGSYSYSMMPKVHNLADIFVLPSLPIPSWQEQFGYVLVESMACGKPVISTLSGSIPEVVANAGVLVQPNDFLSIAGALEMLVRDENKRRELGIMARKRAEDVFSTQKVGLMMKAHYQSLEKDGGN